MGIYIFTFVINRLHHYLLQPRALQPLEGRTNKNAEQICPSKAKKVVGKIKVEGKLVFDVG